MCMWLVTLVYAFNTRELLYRLLLPSSSLNVTSGQCTELRRLELSRQREGNSGVGGRWK